VKNYRQQRSPAQALDGTDKCRDSLECSEEGRKQDMLRHSSDDKTQTESLRRTDRVLSDETNLHQPCLPCKQNLVVSAHSLRSRLPCQVCCSYCR